jgi:tRNA A-37 threonylcarbamoyl transferase component Bud32
MAEVWRADHDGLPVALKFVAVDSEWARKRFAAEARAHAGLQHPHILQVLDVGVLESDIDHGPAAGTPWMALELASGGDLKRITPHLRWRGARIVLLTVLDALAHAHAHGVVHRDLKPGNILLSGEEDARPGLKLADFGIAHLLDEDSTREQETHLHGTPVSLSPEQCRGALREYGPWTDLYALGCLAYRISAGHWPFHGLSIGAALTAHMKRLPPRLAPLWPVPDGFVDWVHRCLAKHPAERFRTCADAAWALYTLPEVRDPHAGVLPPALNASRTVVERAWGTAWPIADSIHSADAAPLAPLAADWRRPASPPTPRPLVRAGLQMFAFRSWDMVGRDAEADRLWSALTDVQRTGRPEVVVLRGPEGVGLSHLGRWFVRRAEALGAAFAFTVTPSPDDARPAPLTRLLAQTLLAEGLRGEKLQRVIEANLDLWNRAGEPLDTGLAELFAGVCEGRLVQPSTRHGAVRRLIRARLGSDPRQQRAGILWIDDCTRSDDALAFADNLLKQSGLPLLVVLGAGEASHPLLEALEQADPSRTLPLAPLTRRKSIQLVRSALPLEAALEARIVDDADGLPRVLAHHLDRLVELGALEAGPQGYRLAAGHRFRPAPSLVDAAGERVASLLNDASETAARALVVAALLGDRVDLALWHDACEPRRPTRTGARERDALLDQLVWAGLAAVHADGFAFANRATRRAILEQADSEVVDDARMDLIAALDRPESSHGSTLQRARLLWDAGQPAAALNLYQRLIFGVDGDGGLHAGDLPALCDEALQLADVLGIPAGDSVREALVSQGLLVRFNTPHVAVHAQKVAQLAARWDWPVAAACAHAMLAENTATSDPPTAEAHIRRAREALDGLQPDRLTTDAETQLVRALHLRERNAEAFDLLMPALKRARDNGWARTYARAAGWESHVRKALGIPIPAPQLLERAREFQRQGYLWQAASLLIDAGDQARLRGAIDESDALNLRAMQLCDLLGMNDPAPQFNLSLNAMVRRDADAARHWLDDGLSCAPKYAWRLTIACLELGWACTALDPEAVRARIRTFRTVRATVGRPLLPEEHEILDRAADTLEPVDRPLADAIRRAAQS